MCRAAAATLCRLLGRHEKLGLDSWSTRKVWDLRFRRIEPNEHIVAPDTERGPAVDLPAGGSAAMTGRFVPRRSGVLSGSVRIEDDALEADNAFFFTVTVPERVSVLLVGGTPADTRFVRLGLTLQGDSTLAGLFALTKLPAGVYPEATFPRIAIIARGGTFEPRDMIVAVTHSVVRKHG